jgi:hypothetical protein
VGKKIFADVAKKNNWLLYSTEEGGVFNPGATNYIQCSDIQ